MLSFKYWSYRDIASNNGGVIALLQFGIIIPLEINLFLLSNDLIVLFCDRWSFGVLLWEIESGGKQF